MWDVAGRTKGASVAIVFLTRMPELPMKRETGKCLFLETPKPCIVYLPINKKCCLLKL